MAVSRIGMKLALLGACLAGGPAVAQTVAPPPVPFPVLAPASAPATDDIVEEIGTPAQVAARFDRSDRFTIPIQIDGQGPFQFIIDTGSQRTILSRELAKALRLTPDQPVRIVSMSGSQQVDTVNVGKLSFGHGDIEDFQAPILGGDNLGASGLLGLDSLQSRRLTISFPSGRMEIAESRLRKRMDPNAIVVEARSRFGQLVLVDSTAGGQKVSVILDTGAQHSIGNVALYRKLTKRDRLPTTRPIALTSVTGQEMIGQWGVVDKIKLGGVVLSGVGIVFMDASPFDELGLGDKPALLLGMDVLSGFEKVEVDFRRRSVNFLLQGGSLAPRSQMAALARMPDTVQR